MSDYDNIKAAIRDLAAAVRSSKYLGSTDVAMLLSLFDEVRADIRADRRTGSGDRRTRRSVPDLRKAPRRVGEDRRAPGIGTPEIGRRNRDARRRIPDRRALRPPNS